MLGWCVECKTLRSITALGLNLGRRECDYAPIHHDAPDTHRGCGGYIQHVEDGEDGVTTCTKCPRPVFPNDVVPGKGLCDGSRKPIR